MKLSTSEHPYKVNLERIGDRRVKTHYLFGVMDDLGGPQKLGEDTWSEAKEFRDELNAPHYNEQAAHSEWTDMWNVATVFLLMKMGRNIRFEDVIRGVNGEAGHSNIFDVLEGRIFDIQDDGRAILEVMRLMESLRMHQTRIQTHSLLDLFAKADEKFRRNYPPKYYAGIDFVTGQPIPEEYCEAAFRHYTKALKMVRAKVKRILKEEDYMKYDLYIADWRNSEIALKMLEQQLAAAPEPETVTVVPHLEQKILRPTNQFIFHINAAKQKQGTIYQAA